MPNLATIVVGALLVVLIAGIVRYLSRNGACSECERCSGCDSCRAGHKQT